MGVGSKLVFFAYGPAVNKHYFKITNISITLLESKVN